MKIGHASDYKARRIVEYPEVTEQLDAVWKALAPQRATLPAETQAMLDKVLAVKAKFPKDKT